MKLHWFAVVKKIEKRKLSPTLPLLIKQLVVWASKKDVNIAKEDESVNLTTLKAYIAGWKAWHMFHDKEYPYQFDGAVEKPLKATRMTKAKFNGIEKKRPPAQLSNLILLLEMLPNEGELGLAMICAALVHF